MEAEPPGEYLALVVEIGVAADHEKDALMREKDRLARELRAVNMVR